ncbi:phage tail tape measure protein [Sinomonas soli]
MSTATETILLAVEAKDKASEVIETVMSKLEAFGKLAEAAGVKAAGGQERLAESAHSSSPKLLGAAVAAGAVAAAAIDIGKRSIEAASQYQEATAKLAAHAGISQAAAEKVGTAFLNTAGDTTFSAQQLMEAFAPVSGQFELLNGHALSASDSLTVMKTASDLAEASGTDLGTTTKSLADVMVAYGIKVADASKASDVLENASRLTGVGVGAVATAVDRLKGRLGVAAPSLGDTGTLMAELASHGITGQRGIMLVNTAMQTLLGSSAGTKKELKTLGVEVYDSSGHFIGMKKVIEELGPKLNGMTDQQRQAAEKALFGASAAGALDGVLKGGATTWDKYSEKVNEAGSAHEAAEKASNTYEGAQKKLEASFKDASIALGQALLPVIQKALDVVMKIVKPILQWVTHNKDLAAGILIAVGALGALTAAVAILNIVLNANPIALVVVAIAGLVAGLIYAYNHVGWFKDFVDKAFKVIATVATWLWKEVFKPVWDGIVSIVGTAWNWLYQNVIQPLIHYFQNVIAPLMTWLWQNVIVPVWQGIQQAIGAAWSWVHDNVVQPILDFINNKLGPAFDWLWHKVIEPAWAGIQKAIGDAWDWVSKNVFDPLGTALGKMGDWFDTAVKDIKKAWDGLKSVAAEPVKFVVQTVWDDGLLKAWNTVAGAFGGPQLAPVDVSKFATGGVVPGYSPGNDIVHAMLSPGEGVLIPQAVQALGGASGIAAINRMYGGGGSLGGGNRFGDGGIVGDVLGAIGNVASGAWNAVTGAVAGGLQGAVSGLFDAVVKPLLGQIPGLGNGKLGTLLQDGVDTAEKGILAFLGKKDDASKATAAASIGAPGAVSGNLAAWVQAAMGAAGVSGNAWLNGLETIAMFESGGNPNAQNNWDVNAQNGDPSRGLMQTIGATFEAYRLSSLPDNIFDPVANAAAAIRYIQSRYGSIGAVPGVASVAHGGGYVGYDSGGWLEPGFTPVWNGTGKRERVISPDGAGPGGGDGITIHVAVTGNNIWDAQAVQQLSTLMGQQIVQELALAGIQIRR